jgi:hypothetical protein
LERPDSVATPKRPIPLSFILLAAVVVHLPLLLAKLPLHTYDATLHIFFASHYLHHWMDPWNPKWYAGFSQTTYPPLPQQWIAVFSHIFGLEMAYMAVQLAAILLLVVGVYRFSRLWVNERAASFAALASVFLGAESFLVYAAGQLSTTSAAPIYLNALPYLFDWVRYGRWKSFLKGLVLFMAAAAAHHATLLFGSMFFAMPVLALAYLDRNEGKPMSTPSFVARTVSIGIAVGVAITVVLLPFWIALIQNPVTQVPIPHASRANYILSPLLGLNYFVIPYGALILVLPFIVLRGSAVVRLSPLLLGFWLAFLIGIGGTTPVGHLLLGRAFEVLTMERFTYWASLLALPFVGLLASELVDRFRTRAVAGLTIAAALTCGFAVAWIVYKPAEAEQFNVDSCAGWLNRDGHDKYRYVTLGFGSHISDLATYTDADSVDGEWNSGRTLPELTQHGGAALTKSKFFGKTGLDALRAILGHADHYGLKWVLVRDPSYDPLLSFVGYRRVDTLENNTITVWGKDGVPPAVPVNSTYKPPRWQGLMWGTLPFGSSLLAILVVLIPEKRRFQDEPGVTHDPAEELAPGRLAI